MLDLNGYTMRINRGVIRMALKIARNEINQEDLVEWVRRRTTRQARKNR